MVFKSLVKFVLICFDSLAWPLFALGYPLHASIRAIEANSITETKQQQDFSLKINFLAEAADEHVKAHGPTEVLSEKLEADPKEGTDPSILHKDIKPVQVTEKRKVAPVNPILETDPNAVRTVNNAVTLPGMEGEAGFDLPSDKQVRKEWTCAMCQVTTTSEKTLNIHLQGRKHRNACERLMKAMNQPSKPKLGLVASAVKDKEPPKYGSICNIQGTQEKQKPPKHQVSASSVAPNNSGFPTDNSSTCNKEMNPKTETSETNQPKEESKKLLPTTNLAGNQLISSENVQGQQQVGKEHSEAKIPQFRCTICNISCVRSEDLNCHLWGKKHLAKIQKLNSLRKNELA